MYFKVLSYGLFILEKEKLTMKYFCRYDSIIGEIILISDGKYLLSLEIGKDNNMVLKENNNLPLFQRVKKWLDIYFQGKEPIANFPLKLEGTAFQKEVWEILLKIPYGKVITYGEIANQIALKRNIPKMSSQAVGNAIHHNPIPIIVPCHRVIGCHHNLVGYGLGMKLKIKLLTLEGIELQGYYLYEKKKKNVVQ